MCGNDLEAATDALLADGLLSEPATDALVCAARAYRRLLHRGLSERAAGRVAERAEAWGLVNFAATAPDGAGDARGAPPSAPAPPLQHPPRAPVRSPRPVDGFARSAGEERDRPGRPRPRRGA